MTIKEILAKAKIDEDGHLDESIVNELEGFIDELVTEKAKLLVQEKLEKALEPAIENAREELLNEYEEKFEEYKEHITSQFSNFVDSVLEEELKIPDYIKEWANVGEKYHDFIQEFRSHIAIDEGCVNEKAQTLICDSRAEIEKLTNEINELTAKNLELHEDAHKLALDAYINEKCENLTTYQRSRMIPLLKGETSVDRINERFDFILNNLLHEENEISLGGQKHGRELEKTCVCPICHKEVTVANDTCCSLLSCPDCENTKLVSPEEMDKKEKVNESKSHSFGVNESVASKAAHYYSLLV